jgi:hypothetical protein
VKDRLGDQRGGSEWEPIKILLQRELGLCPKFTTKDSHTSLSRSRSHNRPTNPRNNPNSKQYGSATQEAKDLGNLRCLGQTVCGGRADGPRGLGGWFARPRRTVRKISPNNQYRTSKYRRSVPYVTTRPGKYGTIA